MSNNIELLSNTENFTIGTNSNLSEILANVVKVGTDTSNVTIYIPQDISSSYNLILPVRQGASGESLVYGADGQLKWDDTSVLKQVVSVYGSNLGSHKVDAGQMNHVSFPTNYEASITPLSANTKIFVQFKVNYKAALSSDNQVDFYIYKNDTNGNTLAIFSESLYGPYIAAGGFVGQYISNLIDEPNRTDEISYKLGYKINGTVDLSDTLGILGYDASYNNTIVLQEFEGSGVYATSVWNKGSDSNGLYYNEGTVHIGSTKDALGSQNTPGVALELSGNLVGTNATFSNEVTANVIRANEGYFSSNTLYINNKPVLNEDTAGNRTVNAEVLISDDSNGLIIKATGNNGNIILDPSGTGTIQLNGDVQLSGGNLNAEIFIGDLSGNVNAITMAATTTTTNNLSLDGTLTTSNSSRVVGNLIPSVDDTYSLGAQDRVWKDVYIGPGSLYLNGTKILDDSSDNINMRTDRDQGLNIQTSGTGTLTLQSETITQINSGNTLASPAQVGSIILNANGGSINVQSDLVLQGSISMSQTGETAVPLNLNDDVDVGGNLDVTGNLDVGGNLKVNKINREDPLYSGLYLESVKVDGSSINGQLTGNVTGHVTGNLVGDVTGNVTGNLVGDVTGNVTGNLVGDVTGNLVGNITGDVNGNLVGNVTGTVSSLSNHTTDILTQGSTNKYFSTTLVDSHLEGGTGVTYSNGSISIGQSVGTSDNVQFNNVTIDGTLNSDDITGSNVTVSNDLVVSGNLTVNGTRTIVNATTLDIGDNKIVVNAAGSTTDAGIIANVSGTEHEFIYSTNNNAWGTTGDLNIGGNVTGTTFIGDGSQLTGITDTNTTYTAGTGLSLDGTTFNNTAPDQTVTLTGSGATTVTGTYPNFTITSTDTNTDTNTTYTAGSNMSLVGTEFNIPQSVGTSDNVQFNQVTASSFIGDGSQLTGITDTTYSAGTGVSINGSNQISIGQSVGTNDSPSFTELSLGVAGTNHGIINLKDVTNVGTETVTQIKGLKSGTNGGEIQFFTKVDNNSLTEKMRITDTGNVGIGTNTPGANLDVSGEIRVLNPVGYPTHFNYQNSNKNYIRGTYTEISGSLEVLGVITNRGVSLNETTVTTSTTQISSLEIDQVIKVDGAVNFVNGDANGWVTFLSGNNFSKGGSYIIQIFTDDRDAGTNGPWHYNYLYTGVMSWSLDPNTNDPDSTQEIPLHGYGHARTGGSDPAIKLRTLSRSGGTIELQIADQQGDKPDNVFNFTFKMRKML